MRFQCPECKGIVAAENSDMGALVQCGHCSKQVSVPASRTSSGSVIGDFVILHELGRGGMGIVYQAHQISLDRPAALKILADNYASNTDFIVGFIKEARAAAKLNHPNIVQAYAVGDDDGIFYFAMEHVDGETMKTILKRKNVIPYKEAAGIIQQVAEALDYAWKEEKLVHRDIKPDNIMLTSSGRAKLADLGLAKVGDESDGSTDSDEVMGTPQYISPEQLTGDPLDNRTDIYSLGATFYHFLTGRFPYEGANAIEITRQHLFGTLIPVNQVNPDVPESLARVVEKMMAKDPNMRYQSAADLAEDLALIKRDRAPQMATETGAIQVQISNKTETQNRPVPPKLQLKGAAAQKNKKVQGTETVAEVHPKEQSHSGAPKLNLSKAKAAPKLAVPKPAEAPKPEEGIKPKLSLSKPAAPEVPKTPEVSKPAAPEAPKPEEKPAARKKPSLALKKEEPVPPPAPASTPEQNQTTDNHPTEQEIKPAEEKKDGKKKKKNTDKKFSVGKLIVLIVVLLILGGAGTLSYFIFVKKSISIQKIQSSATDMLAQAKPKEPSAFFKTAAPLVEKIKMEGTTNKQAVMAECYAFFSKNLVPENEEETKLQNDIIEYFTPIDEDKCEPVRQQKCTDYENKKERQRIQSIEAAAKRQIAERDRIAAEKDRKVLEAAQLAVKKADENKYNAERTKKLRAVNNYKYQIATKEKNLYLDIIKDGKKNDIAEYRKKLENNINEPAPEKDLQSYSDKLRTISKNLLDTMEKGWEWEKYLTDGIPQLVNDKVKYKGEFRTIKEIKAGKIELQNSSGKSMKIEVSDLFYNKTFRENLYLAAAALKKLEHLAYYYFWHNDFRKAHEIRMLIEDNAAKQRFSKLASDFLAVADKVPSERAMLAKGFADYPEYLKLHPKPKPQVRKPAPKQTPKKQPAKTQAAPKKQPAKTQPKKK